MKNNLIKEKIKKTKVLEVINCSYTIDLWYVVFDIRY